MRQAAKCEIVARQKGGVQVGPGQLCAWLSGRAGRGQGGEEGRSSPSRCSSSRSTGTT